MHAGSFLRALRAGVFAAFCVVLASVGHTLMSGGSVPDWLLLPAWLGVALAAWSLAARERGPLLVGALTVGTQALLHCLFSLGQAAAAYAGGNGGPLNGRWAAALLGPHAPPGEPGGGSPHGPGPAHADSAHAGSAYAGPGPADPGHAGSPYVAHGPGPEHAVHSFHSFHSVHHAPYTDTAFVAGRHPGAAIPAAAPDVSPDAAPGVEGMAHGAMPGGALGMIAAHLVVALLSAWWLWRGERAVFRAVRAASVRLFAPLLLAADVVLPAPAPVIRAASAEPPRAPRRLFLSHVIWLRGPPPGPAV